MSSNIRTYLKRSKQVLGMNARILDYLRPYNPKRARHIADDKLLTKKALLRADVPTPELLGVIHDKLELAEFDFDSLPSSFVVKPNFGFGGGGIKVVFGRHKDGDFIMGGSERVDDDFLKQHIVNILDGNFSLRNIPDISFFEQRVRITKLLKPYSFQGIPDVRVVVFNGVPVMAMLRLPTVQSKGKANLHQGGIGVGIDIADGVTTTAIQRHIITGADRIVEYVPKTRLLLSGVAIPDWDRVLRIAVRCGEVLGLGYAGVDIALDRDLGPLVIEVNARPGLSIQNANLAPLLTRLRRVQGITVKSTDHGIRLSKELFGGDVEKELEGISGRKVVGTVEKIHLESKHHKEVDIEAKIDTGADSTSIDVDLAETLGFGAAWKAFQASGYVRPMTIEEAEQLAKEKHDELVALHEDIVDVRHVGSSSGATLRPYVFLKLKLSGRIVSSKASIVDRKGLKYSMIVGRKDLKRFLVDVTKK